MKPTQAGLKAVFDILMPNLDKEFVVNDKHFSIFNLEYMEYPEFSTIDITVKCERKVMITRVYSNRMSLSTHGVAGNIYLKKKDFDDVKVAAEKINKAVEGYILGYYF